MLAPVVKEQRLCTALTFIVARAWSNWVDVPPIVFRLRMHRRITIDLRCRSLQDFGTHAFGKAKHVNGAVYRRLRRLHRLILVMNRRCGTCEIVDLIDLEIDRECHVVTDEFEALLANEVLYVAARAGEKIVDADDFRAPRQQMVAQMRTEEARAAGHHDALLKVHD